MKLDYAIVYSDRRTIRITVERDRRVVVRAPRHARPEIISAAVEGKRLWIWNKIHDARKYGAGQTKEFVVGEGFLLLGQGYRLALTDGPNRGLRFDGRQFQLARQDARMGREAFKEWYLAFAKEHLPERVISVARAMGMKFKRVCIRDLKYRWGSCTQHGTLTFNWRIVQAPGIVVDYLIAHELAHVLVPTHSSEFWNMVAVHVPAMERARSWLRTHAESLEW